MMLLVRPPDRQQIWIFCISQKPNALVNKNIVHKKVSHSIYGDPKSDIKQVVIIINGTDVHQYDRRNGKDQKEVIVSLQWPFIAVVVVVAVQHPQKSVHHVFVDHPGGAFHQKYSGYDY